MPESRSHSKFGGKWTIKKLKILKDYLDSYTTALKNQKFKLIYIDAFAGKGSIQLSTGKNQKSLFLGDKDMDSVISGSAALAINIEDKPFDKLIFVEKDRKCFKILEALKYKHPERNIDVKHSDANSFLQNLKVNWIKWRGVVFLDPFGTAVEWKTIKAISSFEALDTWILFPISGIARMLPTSKRPEDISKSNAVRLTKIYGNESWRNLYNLNPQNSLFSKVEGDNYFRDTGVDGLLNIYKENLSKLFKGRLLKTTKPLLNSRDSRLFELIFCAGNPAGADLAKKIVKAILDKK